MKRSIIDLARLPDFFDNFDKYLIIHFDESPSFHGTTNAVRNLNAEFMNISEVKQYSEVIGSLTDPLNKENYQKLSNNRGKKEHNLFCQCFLCLHKKWLEKKNNNSMIKIKTKEKKDNNSFYIKKNTEPCVTARFTIVEKQRSQKNFIVKKVTKKKLNIN